MRFEPSSTERALHVGRVGKTPFAELVIDTAPVRTVVELDARQVSKLVARLTEVMAEVSEEQQRELRKWISA